MIDTVFDRDYSAEPIEEPNGYTVYQPHLTGIESAMRRAIGIWYGYPAEFRLLMVNGIRCDYSGSRSGTDYINIYGHISYMR